MGWPGVTVAGRCGAAYTGRGPVCGVITRRGGTLGAVDIDGAGPEAAGAAGRCAMGAGGFGGAAAASMLGIVAATGGAVTRTAGRGVTGLAGGALGRGDTATGAAGFAIAFGGSAGFTGSGAAVFWIAFSTSPGLEIFERSILGLNSSAAVLARGFSVASLLLKCLRTFSAASGSMELEWLFFSVTPMFGSRSRIALLLTSSSRAKSLMRTLSMP